MDIFIELSIIIVIAVLISCVMRIFRQPLVVGYIITGVLVGPYFLNVLHSTEYVELFSKLGIAILLFIVGVSLNPIVIREVGKAAFVTGLGQVLFTSVIGFGLVLALGFDVVTAIYASIALTFSSTIIILKLLSDKGDLGKLYGRISIGFLLVQDLIATAILLAVSTISSTGASGAFETFALLLVKGAALVAALFVVSRYLLPRLTGFFASSQELLFLFSVAWGLGMASIFYVLGFSIEIGALIAGVTLSLSPFSYEIGSRVKPLRDFFIVLFFIMLGSGIVISEISSLIFPAAVLSAFVLVGNPFIVFILMNLLGYRRKTAFQAGLTVAQISEFSLILAALAFSVGHITQQAVSLITLVGIVTIAGSTYLILYSDGIYRRIEWLLKLMELRKGRPHEHRHKDDQADIIIFGYDRVGTDFVKAAEKLGGKFLVVDYNPTSIRKLQDKNLPFKFGDAEDVEFLGEIGFGSAKFIVSTVPDFKANMLLVRMYRKDNPDGIIMVISHDVEQAEKLYLEGASYVVMPHYLGAHYAAQLIERHGFDHAEFERERNLHLSRLSKRDTR